VQKNLRATVRELIRRGAAVSVELGLTTGMETKRSGFSIMGDKKVIRTEEKYVSHWTPLKDEEGRSSWVVLPLHRNKDGVDGICLKVLDEKLD
jgi:phototropin